MPDVLQNTLTVEVGGITYIFAVPSFQDEIRLGLREREIRRSLEREMFGPEYISTGEPTYDQATDFLVRTAAQFELLLRRCSSDWPYSRDETGAPKVDFTKWPLDKTEEAARVGGAFQVELRRFRTNGAGNGKPAGAETVAGQPDTANVPVPSGPAGA